MDGGSEEEVEVFCTYFDHRYLPRGLAMWESLKRHRPAAELHVLGLTPSCHAMVESLGLPGVHVLGLPAVERAFPALNAVKGSRTSLEYYFTLTPVLPLYLMSGRPEIRRITYLDADLFFFKDPEPVFAELKEASIGIIEHRFPESLRSLERYGRFNVGWVTFRNDDRARACLRRWHEQCLEWCYQREDPSRFADQKYLDDWPERVAGVRVITHKGANVAPWNLGRFPVTKENGDLLVDGEPLLFFHAHGFEPKGPGRNGTLNLGRYGVAESPLLLGGIFEPYARALSAATSRVATDLVEVLLREGRPKEMGVIAERLRARGGLPTP